ncbi:protein arginine N-methyltransferase 7-like [Amphiura filiformis]|uniref:protein arginine N-methyltransferase 7-like n=1 Tax=Amphiura filiformis TaxID=82378 RepID=UPI003B2125A0
MLPTPSKPLHHFLKYCSHCAISSHRFHPLLTHIANRLSTTTCHHDSATMSDMSAPLRSRVNPATGASEWVVEDEAYDYHQEIARSAYTDMLHDDERNKKYYEGIRRAIKLMHSRGKKAKVIDIGTGTGLLAMMAASSGADTVHACEAFPPIAEAANKIVVQNGFSDKIKVISKRSTEVIVGPGGDLPEKANILVAEVFDTELIGEGAVPTYLHAHEYLLEKDCICVPHSSTIFAQVIQSELVWNWHKLQPVKVPGCSDIIPPREMDTCAGAASVHDLQLSQVSPDKFTSITEPLKMIDFNFTKGDFDEERTTVTGTRTINEGHCHGLFVWWELIMDTEGEVRLSTAPTWAHPDRDKAQWRDHWMQAVYFFDRPLYTKKDEQVQLILSHDDYSLWFKIRPGNNNHGPIHASPERPICHCGGHVIFSRPRIGMLNDHERTNKYLQILQKKITDSSICLSASDGSTIALAAARLGAKVYSLEPTPMAHRVMNTMLHANGLTDRVILLDKRAQDMESSDINHEKIDILMAEPFYLTSLLPWHNLYFWYARTALANHLADDALILPRSASLRGIAVEFEHLWKFHAPVGQLEGFDVTTFDNIVQRSSELSDADTEPQPLWEYPGKALTHDFDLMTFDFTKPMPATNAVECGQVPFKWGGTCHGIVLWMDYHLDENTTVSTGLQHRVKNSSRALHWDRHSKQGVQFIKTNPRVEGNEMEALEFEVTFNPTHGNVHFEFGIER